MGVVTLSESAGAELGFAEVTITGTCDIAVLEALWVPDQFRRKGMGEALVGVVKAFARSMDAKLLFTTPIPSERIDAQFKLRPAPNQSGTASLCHWYRKQGFAPSGALPLENWCVAQGTYVLLL